MGATCDVMGASATGKVFLVKMRERLATSTCLWYNLGAGGKEWLTMGTATFQFMAYECVGVSQYLFFKGRGHQEWVSLNVESKIWCNLNYFGGPRDVHDCVGIASRGEMLYMYGNWRDGPGFISIFRLGIASPTEPLGPKRMSNELNGTLAGLWRTYSLPSPLRQGCSAVLA